jgi:ABC-2 type transport system permease protein
LSAGVVQSIVEEFVSRVEVGRVGGQVAVTQLVAHGLIVREDVPEVGRAIGERQAGTDAGAALITLRRTSLAPESEPVEFDVLAYLAPGMALMFLMFTVSNGGRSILAERALGTLPRLLIAPTTAAQVLGGKLLGIFLTGVAQLVILIGASTLFFGLRWGDPLGVIALVLAAAAGATGWGAVLAAFARSPAQVSSVGSALMLMFGILGGSFISLDTFPTWVQTISRVTPNAWGLDGFTTLGLGGTLADIATPIMALLTMAAVLFTAAVMLFRRQGIVQR